MGQSVKNLPAMWDTWVPSLGWEDPLEEGMAAHSSSLARRIPKDRLLRRRNYMCGSAQFHKSFNSRVRSEKHKVQHAISGLSVRGQTAGITGSL